MGLLAAGLFGSPLVAQLPSFKLPDNKVEAPKEETPEDKRKRLKSWLDDWRGQVEALDKGVPPPAGITAEEVAARRSELLLGNFTAENSIRSLDTADILIRLLDLVLALDQLALEHVHRRLVGPHAGADALLLPPQLVMDDEGVRTRLVEALPLRVFLPGLGDRLPEDVRGIERADGILRGEVAEQ